VSEADRLKWDRKHAARTEQVAVNALLTRYLAEASLGRALDLACGKGQNAIHLAESGFTVDAVDVSPVALASLDHPAIRAIVADLDTYPIARASYTLILDTFFYDGRLLPGMRDGLVRGGLLVFQTFSNRCRRMNPAFTVDPAALDEAFTGFEILQRHIDVDGILSFVARKP